MVYFFRLVFLCAIAFMGTFANAACTKYYIGWRGQSGPLMSTKDSACSAINGMKVSGGSGSSYWVTTVSGASVNASGYCTFKETTEYPSATPKPSPSVSNSQALFSQKTVTDCGCPVGMEENSSGTCVCKAGLEKGPDGMCVPTADTECKTFYAINNTIGGSLGTADYRLQGNVADGSVYCMPGQFEDLKRGCKVVFDWSAYYDYGDGHSVTEGRFDGKPGDTGLSCNVGDVETPAKPPDEKCKNGYSGTVNGVEVCVDKVPNSGVGSDDHTTTNNDGTNTTTTNTHSETNCKDGKCTTTTTTTTTITNNSTGTSTTSTNTGSTTESQGTFCQKNPTSKACGGGNGDDKPSNFSGSCSAGFQCEGDAIQCSIAREQHKRACKLFDDKSAESELYDQNKGKEGNQTKDLPGNETISIQGKIDTSDAIGGGSAGLSDLNIMVWHTNVSLPFSMLNKYLAAMGNVLLAVSLLVAFRIVARG